MVYKMISCEQVIAKVLADLDIREEAIRVSDFREWCSEAVEKIGSVKQLKRKVSGSTGTPILKVVGHQVALPSDLYRLNSVMWSNSGTGGWMPMTIATGSFSVWSDKDIQNNDTTVMGIGRKVQDLKYAIKPGYIMTNIADGYLKLSYDAMYTDDNGYPMIPDMMSYIEAVYWYITLKLKYPEYMAGRLQRQIYYDMKTSWNFYCKQAYGESLMPNADEMETIKNNWIKLVPDIYANNNSYDTIGEVQSIKSGNNGW